MKRASMLLALAVSGCAAFAAKSDYADYRQVRMAENDEARLLAMQHYVAAHPDGEWLGEVQAARKARDMEVFESGKSHRAGLELYLQAFPDGAFASQAQSRLAAIEMIERRKREEAERAEQLRQERKRRDAELSRTWVSRFAGYWVQTLLAIDAWGAPIETVAKQNPAFSRAFGRAPRPRCSTEECVKYYDSNYGVPVPGGTRVERQMRLLLRLGLVEGKLVRAELLLPSWGFSRWHEVEERQLVVDADPEQRLSAVQWALSRLRAMLTEQGRAPSPLSDFVLPPIAAPAIGASGELADTTAADPTAPANRIQQGSSNLEDAPMSELLAPVEPEAPADMVMAPLQVDEKGTPTARGSEAATPPAGAPGAGPGAGEAMVMSPLQVPTDGSTDAQPSEPGQAVPSTPQLSQAPRQVEAFTIGRLRVALVAAGTDEGAPAYDGLVIELVK